MGIEPTRSPEGTPQTALKAAGDTSHRPLPQGAEVYRPTRQRRRETNAARKR